MKKVIYIIMIILIIVPCSAKATTLGDLYNDLSALEKSYNASKSKANLSKAELNNIKASIANTEAEIVQAQRNIEKAEKEIKESEEKIKEKKEETNQMLLYLQLSDGQQDSLLQYIFEADSYTDFIYRYSVVTQMSDYNQELLDQLNKLISELNQKKVNLAQEQKNLASKKASLQSKYAIVQAQYKEETDAGLSVGEKVTEMRKQIKYYENLGCTKSQNIATCGRRSAPSGSRASASKDSVSGWVYPLSSFTQYSNYGKDCTPDCRLHYAVDLSVPEKTPVYAVRKGQIVSVKTSTKGGLIIQIRHEYNGSSYVSIYMHLYSGICEDIERCRNQEVATGQYIGLSGGGSREQARWHDTATEGPHLHFGISQGPGLIGYSSEKGSTFNPVRFFPAMWGYGAKL